MREPADFILEHLRTMQAIISDVEAKLAEAVLQLERLGAGDEKSSNSLGIGGQQAAIACAEEGAK